MTTERARAGRTAPVRSLGHGALWSGVNTLVMKLASIAITAIVVRMITPYDFGIFAVALVAFAIVSSFGELGLSACIARRDLDPDEAGPVVALLALLSCAALAGAMAGFAPQIGAALGAVEAAGAIRVLSICILITGFTTVPSAMLLRDFRQGRLFAATAISFIPANAVLVVLAAAGDGAMAFAWSRVVGQVISSIVVISAVRPNYMPRWNTPVARQVLGLGLPLAGANLLDYLLLSADYVFIGRMLGASMLGTYMLAFNVASWSTSVLGATINGVAMPAFSGLRKDPQALLGALERWLRFAALVAFPISAATVAFAPDVLHTLYGSNWDSAAPILAVLAIYGGVFVLSLLLSNFLVGTGRTGRVFIIHAVWLAVLLPAIAAGISFGGTIGVAVAHVVVILFVIVPMYMWAMKESAPGIAAILWRAVRGPLAASILAVLVALVAVIAIDGSLARLALGSTVGALVYGIAALPMIRTHLPERYAQRLAGPIAIVERRWPRRAES